MIRRIFSFLAIFLFLACVAVGQQNPPGWTFSTAAGYSNVTNAPTNDGFANVTELKLSEYLAIRGDVFVITSPSVIGSFVGPEYIVRADKMFKDNPSNPVHAGNVEFFFNLKVGDLRSTDTSAGALHLTNCAPITNGATCQVSGTAKAKFSWGLGAGFNIRLSDKTFIRPLDVSYIRGSVFQGGGTVLGNHLQAAAFLGVRF